MEIKYRDYTQILLWCYSVIKIVTECHDFDKNFLSMSIILRLHTKTVLSLDKSFKKNVIIVVKMSQKKEIVKKHIHT